MATEIILFEEIKVEIDRFIAANKDFSAGIDFVIGVSRGGMVPAALVAAQIDKPLVAAYINKQDEIFFDRADWVKDKNILVVDDIIRSGKTMWLLKNHLEINSKPKNISFFALFKVISLFNKNYDINILTKEVGEDFVFPWDN